MSDEKGPRRGVSLRPGHAIATGSRADAEWIARRFAPEGGYVPRRQYWGRVRQFERDLDRLESQIATNLNQRGRECENENTD